MSIITNSFRKLSQQQQENNQVKIYYKSDLKQFVKVIYNRATTIEQIINELIKQLNLNNKLQYQINLMTHTNNEPAQGGILLRRKLRKKDQPFKILHYNKTFKFSFFLDYYLSQLSINNTSFNQNILIDEQNGIKFDKEFKIQKLTKVGNAQPIKIQLNSKGLQLKQDGKMEKFIDYSECQVEFGENYVITINHSDKITLYQANNKSDFCSINKLIYKYTKNFEIKHIIFDQDHKIHNYTQQRMDSIELNCFLHAKSKQCLKLFHDYNQFMDIFKQTQVVTNLADLENDNLDVDIEPFKSKILETFSILPREQFREKLIKLNSSFKLIASCKLENMIEETEDQLITQLDYVLVSEEEARKYSQFLV